MRTFIYLWWHALYQKLGSFHANYDQMIKSDFKFMKDDEIELSDCKI